MVGPATELLEILTASAGDSLRSIAIYGPETGAFVYQRDDLRECYLSDDIAAIHDALVDGGLSGAYLEDLFEAGELECSIHIFEQVTMLHFAGGPRQGLFVSVDASEDVAIEDVSARCRAWLYEQDFDALLADA